MRVTTNGLYDAGARRMAQLSARADAAQTSIATGKRVVAPSDDAPAWRALAGLARAKTDGKAYEGNLDLAAGVLATADAALGNMAERLQRATELAVEAANGTYTADQRRSIGAELSEVLDTLVGIANGSDARGRPLFGGADGGPALTAVAGGGFALASTTPSAIPVGEGQSVQANESARRVFGFSGAGGPTDMFAVVAGLAAALAAGDATGEAARAAIDDLNLAGDQLANAQGSLGARAARVEVALTLADEAAGAREEARGALEDTDIATAVTELQKTMTVLQATQASFAKLSALSLFDYLR